MGGHENGYDGFGNFIGLAGLSELPFWFGITSTHFSIQGHAVFAASW